MDENLPNNNLFSNNFKGDVFLFLTAIISLLVTTLVIYFLCKHKETQNASNQSCFTANKRSRCTNNTGRCQYSMYLQNSVLYNFGFEYFNFWPSDFCSSTHQKTKAVQRTFVLKHS